mmetsp:Transcript_1149/g.1907  ORF Transcript_1149/g.1907 Transcript_1149/m.1907 type:complete len:94 (-) Transcript_1149:60-341(-)|eukprot:CAMPEP_0197437568 /NCGR_PEP_ID=MMETSP1175-20131217/4787_1 /TAXON_ID=1003142 /ORGANISM="Triceratium dubium, Strain CCMP147" /LENGTH=93 /DNA_ID=CAMNT_0042967135 /DNA_START=74 /DNA_END=355 /DNA_ORIENTATION=-
MKYLAAATVAVTALASASAFVPVTSPFGVAREAVCLEAKHVMKKATKKHRDRRPKKTRRSDRIRAPIVYPEPEWVPPEYTISDAPASPAAKPE